MEQTDQEVLDARAKLAARFGDGARTGGKGMLAAHESDFPTMFFMICSITKICSK
jgi:hypothetical protein